MTTLLSIRIQESVLQNLKVNAERLQLTQTEYIRQAIEKMNHDTEKADRRKRLQRASLKVQGESLKVNAEFSELEDDPEA